MSDNIDNIIEEKLEFVESVFSKMGAVPIDVNKEKREKFDLRMPYKYKDNYYRADYLKYADSDEQYVVISCTDNEKYADIGIMDDIDALSFTLSDDEIESRIRALLEDQ